METDEATVTTTFGSMPAGCDWSSEVGPPSALSVVVGDTMVAVLDEAVEEAENRVGEEDTVVLVLDGDDDVADACPPLSSCCLASAVKSKESSLPRILLKNLSFKDCQVAPRTTRLSSICCHIPMPPVALQ